MSYELPEYPLLFAVVCAQKSEISSQLRSNSSNASTSSIVSASSNSVSYVPKENSLVSESGKESQEFFTCNEKTLANESGGVSQEYYTCPSQQSSELETTITETNPEYEMEEVEDEFVGD